MFIKGLGLSLLGVQCFETPCIKAAKPEVWYAGPCLVDGQEEGNTGDHDGGGGVQLR